MKESTILAIFLGVIIALAFGGLLGYMGARERMQKEAVANGVGHYTIVQGGTEFAWGQPRD
jgi:hypothetical protein